MGIRKAIVTVVAGGLLAAALAFWVARPSGKIRPEGPPPAEGEEANVRVNPPSPLEGKLAANQAELSRQIEELRARLLAREDGAQPKQETTKQENKKNDVARDRSAREALTERLSQLDQTFHNQAVDGAWNREAEAKLESLFTAPTLAGARLGLVACRSTLCKMQVHVPESDGLEPLVDAFPQVLGWKTDGFVNIRNRANGEMEAVLFFSRPGHQLPPVAAAQAP